MDSNERIRAASADAGMPTGRRTLTTIKAALRTLSPDCRDASRLQSQGFAPSLSWPKRIGLRLHLLLCHWCRRYGKQLRFLQHAIHEHPEDVNPPAPQSLSPEARERLQRSLRDKAR